MIKQLWLLTPVLMLVLQGCTSLIDRELTGEDEYILTISMDEKFHITLSDSNKMYPGGSRWNISPGIRKTVNRLKADYGFTILDSWPLDLINEFCVVVRMNRLLADRLRMDTRIVDLQFMNHFVSLKSSPPYNDSRLSIQLGSHVEAMSRLHEWSTGNDIEVGIIDTTIDLKHPDLRDKIASQKTFVHNTPDARDKVHGTAIAGIIAAEANNGIGIVGYAPDVILRSYVACYFRDDWQQTVCNTFALVKALASAAADNLQVINMSLAGPPDRLIKRMIEGLIKLDVIIVASDNPLNPSQRFPASMPQVIGASIQSDLRIMEPVLIKTDDEHLTTRSGGEYQFFYGSSMSAARVTALVSLLLEKNPNLGIWETRQLLFGASNGCELKPDDDVCLMSFALGPQQIKLSQGDASWSE